MAGKIFGHIHESLLRYNRVTQISAVNRGKWVTRWRLSRRAGYKTKIARGLKKVKANCLAYMVNLVNPKILFSVISEF